MTRQEINYKISELRDQWDWNDQCIYLEDCRKAKDWHLDTNWPTLLRELPAPELFRYMHVEEAVCLARLKWKER